MPAPVIEQIALAVKARIEKATETNGYPLTILRVERPTKLSESKAEDKLARLVQGDVEKADELEGNAYRLEWKQTFWIGLYVVPSDNDIAPLDTQINLLRSSAEKAIATPETAGQDWAQWSGLAVNSEFGAPVDLTPDDGRYTGLALQLLVSYRTPFNDPFNSA